jgi:dTMP kinase
LRMKLQALIVFVAVCVLTLIWRIPPYVLPAVVFVGFAVYGVARSIRSRLDPLNDLPNAFRLLLASSGGVLVTMWGTFILPSAAILFLLGAIFLNDEYQRRTIDSIRSGRRGGSVALLGIDGSGKSSHALMTREWLVSRGYRALLMPFHRYLFVERLSQLRSAVRGPEGTPRRSGNPFRPVLSLLDNLLLQLSSSVGCRLEGRVVLYDRFIWSTYIKYYALGYPVRPLSGIYLMPRPVCAVVLDVPVERSLEVINSRESHIRYPRRVLETEREFYLRIARERDYPVIDSTRDSKTVQNKVERYLSAYFPVVARGGPS